MNKISINPWQWQDNFGYAQAIEVKNNTGTLYCAGQAAMDANGKPVSGNMSEQIKLSLENLHQVVKQAGYDPSNIVRLNFFTTSVPAFFEAYGTAIEWMKQHHCTPSSTLLQIGALAFPELTIEIEATVVK
jgi:enamine deaminase RidA (YjgF/YER057c/UK114 family)